MICAVYNTLLLQLWYNLSHSCQRNYLALFFYLHSSVINEIKLPTGNSIYDSDELSDAFNDHFYSIGTRLANDIQVNVDSISRLDYLTTTFNCSFQLKTTPVSPKLLRSYPNYVNQNLLVWTQHLRLSCANVLF